MQMGALHSRNSLRIPGTISALASVTLSTVQYYITYVGAAQTAVGEPVPVPTLFGDLN
jgi:hypothetical protein